MRLRRAYCPKKVDLLLVDGAGTLYDPGSRMPTKAFELAFRKLGLTVAPETINKFMGREKKEHTRAILAEPDTYGQFRKKYKRAPTEKDVASIYGSVKDSLLVAAETVREIPGVYEAILDLRARGVKIVMTTGYDRETAQKIFSNLVRIGNILDGIVTNSDVLQGRPAPFMLYRGMESASVYEVSHALNVGDTEADMRASDHARMAGILVTSGVVPDWESGAKIANKLGREHLVLPSLVEVIEYVLDGSIYDRI